ncbi:MAG: glycosyltransferase family 39 protein [Anaerolineales bacterium]|nr:glycosyltransferase family 39 protein [Anaerolineales bacterium]
MTIETSDLQTKGQAHRKPGVAARLTITEALFGLVALAAGVLRLANLGHIPLSPAEAEAALTVWRFWQPGQAMLAPSSPAYFTLTAVLTQILGFSDAVMRLVPALFGVALVLLPWLLRQRLGAAGALVTAVFLTVSPITVTVSRTAGGEAIALFAVFLLLAAWVRWQDAGDGRWAITMATALGLGLASAPLFYSGLAALAVAWFLQLTLGPRLGHLAEEAVDKESETAVWPKAALVGLFTFLALTTTFLLNISSLGAAATLLSAWLQQFGRSDLVPASTPILAMMRYEMGLLVLGLAAAVWAGWRGHSLGRLALYWLAGVVLLLLAQLGVIANAALAPLAGYLLIGSFTGSVIGDHIHRRAWALGGGLLLIWGLIFVNVSRYLRTSVFDATDMTHIWIAIFGLTLGLTAIYFLITWDGRSTYQGILFSLIGILVFYNWGTAWWLGQEGANDPRETWVTTGADNEVPLLIGEIRDLSWQVAGSATDVDIFSAVNSPILAWYLRDFPNFQMGSAVPPAATASLILTPDGTEPAFGSDYLGADYAWLRSGVAQEGFVQSRVLDTLRWWVFQESTAVTQKQRLILWLRADLTQ